MPHVSGARRTKSLSTKNHYQRARLTVVAQFPCLKTTSMMTRRPSFRGESLTGHTNHTLWQPTLHHASWPYHMEGSPNGDVTLIVVPLGKLTWWTNHQVAHHRLRACTYWLYGRFFTKLVGREGVSLTKHGHNSVAALKFKLVIRVFSWMMWQGRESCTDLVVEWKPRMAVYVI